MHPALLILLRLSVRSLIRRILHSLKTPRGAIFLGLSLFMLCLWVGPTILAAFTNERADPESVRVLAPLALLGMCVGVTVTSAGERAVYFTPDEVDFLFAGPFTRRELLGYKVLCSTLGAIFTALFISVFLLRAGTWWIAVYIGAFLALLFIQFLSMTFVLIRQIVTEHAYTRLRKLLLAAVVTLIAVGLWQALAVGAEQGFMALLRQFRETWAGYCLLAPFDVFSRTITAETLFPGLAGWATLALSVDLALLVLVMRLDANYLEAAAAISQKIYSRTERAKRAGVVAASVSRRSARWHMPSLPRIGGVGPIAWRQLTTAMRNARGPLFVLVIIAIGAGPAAMLLARGDDIPGPMVWTLIGLAAWMSLWFTMIVPFDFRGDLDRMDWLKMLPLRPMAIVLGQLAAPVLIFTALHILLFSGFAVLVESWRLVLFAASMFILPYNFLHFGVDNLIFLLFPTRMGAVSPGDFQAFGRQMAVFLIKISSLLVCCGVAAGLGFLAFWLVAKSWVVFTLVSWVALVLMAAAVVPYIAWAFERFDVSVDTPA